MYGITTVGFGSLLLNELGWYGSNGFFNIPAWRVSLTLNCSAESELVSLDFFVFKSIGFGAPLLNAKQTACPFLDKMELQEVILVFLNMAVDLLTLSVCRIDSRSTLSCYLMALSSSSFAY